MGGEKEYHRARPPPPPARPPRTAGGTPPQATHALGAAVRVRHGSAGVALDAQQPARAGPRRTAFPLVRRGGGGEPGFGLQPLEAPGDPRPPTPASRRPLTRERRVHTYLVAQTPSLGQNNDGRRRRGCPPRLTPAYRGRAPATGHPPRPHRCSGKGGRGGRPPHGASWSTPARGLVRAGRGHAGAEGRSGKASPRSPRAGTAGSRRGPRIGTW